MNNQKPPQAAAIEPLARLSYSQNLEDILLDRVFEGRPGTFMDVGANHPFLESNTYFFYLRGWRGVNLEPIARNHALFLELRPDDLNLAIAASDSEGDLTFHEITKGEGLGGHLSTLSSEVAEEHRAHGFEVSTYPVPVRTVASLVAEHRIDPPDFLSIDVEGHEGAVIRGIPWATWRPKVLVIEAIHPQNHLSTHESWEPLLREHGYRFAAFNGLNRFYLRDDLSEKLVLFQTPVNCFDLYRRADEAMMQAEVDALNLQVQYLQREYDRIAAERDWDRSNFDRIRAGWEWGQSQAELVRQGFERETAAFEWHRSNFDQARQRFEHERECWESERADRERERGEWAWERAEWEKERASWAWHRGEWEQERDRSEQERAHHARERAEWARRSAEREQERAERDEERARSSWELAEWERRSAEWERERAERDQERSLHAWERAEWERQLADWVRERAGWDEAKLEFDRMWAAWEWERAALEQGRTAARDEADALRQQLVSTQRALRPYRLLDRLGVVSAGFGMARKVKRRLAG